MQRALGVIADVHEDWAKHVGRRFAPLVEAYRMDGAEYALVTIGSMTGAAKDAVDEARARGAKAGLVKVKTFRPFPAAALIEALGGARAVGVVDRSVSFGWNCGPVYQDVMTALAFAGKAVPTLSFIGGLAGADLTIEHFGRVIGEVAAVSHGAAEPGRTIWLNQSD
jgi:pyruvate ferredoxin oxidoreductase alpha subunit/phenylglyoxylate dehydrogenase alpha subunit